MAVQYEATLQYENGELVLTQVLLDKSEDTRIIPVEEISHITRVCQDYRWYYSQNTSREIGQKLFNLLNGDRQTLTRALKEADAHGEHLQLLIQVEKPSDFPFELLYSHKFLVPSQVDLIRRVSGYGHKRRLEPENRPLKVLFMACSPEGVSALDYEKEEEAILTITRNLPVEIDVEDTGSLEGLKDRLRQSYDVIHLSGHAGIDEKPFFYMEDDEGGPVKVYPSQLMEVLGNNRPRLVFLSGCKTGQTPNGAVSFAHFLVSEHCPAVLGWGLPVLDPHATAAAAHLYEQLSWGKSILDAVFSAREYLFKNDVRDWSLLRLFSDGTPLNPLVCENQEVKPKKRDLQYIYLGNSQVKILKEGFVGRRRQIQRGIKCLRTDLQKVGLLLHGTGGLGKSCLAGKICERFKDHTLIIVHGRLRDSTFYEALKDAFIRKDDEKGLEILQQSEEMPLKVRQLCSSSFRETSYMILLDDFEQNLENVEEGNPVVTAEAVPVLETLLLYLPYAGGKTHLIITSRYIFPLTVGRDLVEERLECLGLTSFTGADERKKVMNLDHIVGYPDSSVRQKLIEAGRGNPRLMEDLNLLLGVEKHLDVNSLLGRVQGKQEEFVQELILKEIFERQTEDFQKVMRRAAVYQLPVLKEGIGIVCKGIKNWHSLVDSGVQLSLMEEDKSKDIGLYWVTPLLQKEIFGELDKKEQKMCHEGAVKYYEKILSFAKGYEPAYGAELIEHALKCGIDEAAVGEGGRLLNYLRNILAYEEALSKGREIISHISGLKRDEKSSRFLFEYGWVLHDVGDSKKAVEYYEQALSIDREVYGERHPSVATRLNNLGSAWDSLGDSKKAVEYYEQALSIDREVYGERHPNVATMLNNLGGAWKSLGDSKKAVEYYEQALSIDREVYGERHPSVATMLSNLGSAWYSLGDSKKAVEYYEQALSIDREVYGERHPSVATDLNNLGGAWDSLGDSKKAVEYIQKAHDIFLEFYGDQHPYTKNAKKWLDYLEKKLG